MESLRFNQHGQWELLKTDKSYRPLHLQGTLPEDKGQRGKVGHPYSRRMKQTSPSKMMGKVPTPVNSEYADRHPGLAPTD